MSSLGGFFLKQIQSSIVTKKVIESSVFMDLIHKMGIKDDLESLQEIVNYLSYNNIEVNFKETERDNYKYFKMIQNSVLLIKNSKMKKEYFNELITKSMNKMPEIESSFLEKYRNEDDN
jgi:hypothetical protein